MANTCIWLIGGGLCGEPTDSLLCRRHRTIADLELALEDAMRAAHPSHLVTAPEEVKVSPTRAGSGAGGARTRSTRSHCAAWARARACPRESRGSS